MDLNEDVTVILDLDRANADPFASLLTSHGLVFKTRQVRAIDGDSELTRIVVAGGTRAAVKLVDGLSALTGDLFRKLRNRAKPAEEPARLVGSNADAHCSFEIRRGDMKLSLENVPLADVRKIIELLDPENDAG